MAEIDSDKLQVREQTAFTWHFGTLQRFGWAVMALLFLLALAGLSGAGGPASRTSLGAAEVPTVMRVGRQDHGTVYAEDRNRPSLGPAAGDWLDVGPPTPSSQGTVLPVTPRRAGLARLTVSTGQDQTADVTVLILP